MYMQTTSKVEFMEQTSVPNWSKRVKDCSIYEDSFINNGTR